LIILAAVLGIYIVLLPILSYLSARQFGFSLFDALPYLLLIVFIGLMLFAPAARNGDLSEYKHRHFPMLYAVFVIYTAHYGCTLTGKLIGERRLKYLVFMFVGGLFIFATIHYQDVNPARPDIQTMPWAGQYHNQPITPGILESADYIRTHAVKGDVAAMTNTSIDGMLANEVIEFISLSGVPAFLARPSLKMGGSECVRKVVNDRLKILEDLSTAETWPDARKIMQSSGIRWLLISNKEKNHWDPEFKEAVFRKKTIAIYDSRAAAYDMYRKPGCN
jgi:hypothetical protein